MDVDRAVSDFDGAAALPRKNGELVFRAPWEGRAFGIGMVLNEKRVYPWNDFRTRLQDEIGRSTADYYESWLNALETLLVVTGVVTRDEVRRRAAEYQALERDPVF
jgi:nitrile hydratase accessory protein